jgi:hypothetical protein
MNSKRFWQINMAGSIGLWILSVVVGFTLFPENHLAAWGLFIGLVIIHTAELPISLKIGKESGFSSQTVVIKTLLFGFTWWLPVKKGIIRA